jgi:hypothetical protein
LIKNVARNKIYTTFAPDKILFNHIKVNLMEENHSKRIPAEVVEQIRQKLNEIKALLAPYAVTLTPTERHDMKKMGERTFTFVEKSYNYAVENPNLVPPYLDMQKFSTDFADAHGLWTIRNDSEQVHEMIDDTAMAAGSEAYGSSLVFYNSTKVATTQDIHGAKAIYDELKKRFAGKKRSTNETGE